MSFSAPSYPSPVVRTSSSLHIRSTTGAAVSRRSNPLKMTPTKIIPSSSCTANPRQPRRESNKVQTVKSPISVASSHPEEHPLPYYPARYQHQPIQARKPLDETPSRLDSSKRLSTLSSHHRVRVTTASSDSDDDDDGDSEDDDDSDWNSSEYEVRHDRTQATSSSYSDHPTATVTSSSHSSTSPSPPIHCHVPSNDSRMASLPATATAAPVEAQHWFKILLVSLSRNGGTRSTRAYRVQSQARLDDLLQQVATKLGYAAATQLTLSYVDEDGDKLVLTCDEDVSRALSLAWQEGSKAPKFYLSVAPTIVPSSLGTAVQLGGRHSDSIWSSKAIFAVLGKLREVWKLSKHVMTSEDSTTTSSSSSSSMTTRAILTKTSYVMAQTIQQQVSGYSNIIIGQMPFLKKTFSSIWGTSCR